MPFLVQAVGVETFVVISGCSSRGKSTLLAELAQRGYITIEELGRRIVKQALQHQGSALPQLAPYAFMQRTLALAQEDLELAKTSSGWVFFDRGLIDAASGLAPPWPEIYVNDPERQHGLDDAIAEYDRLAAVYLALGYDISVLQKLMSGHVPTTF